MELCTSKNMNTRPFKGKSVIALPRDYIVVDTETTGLDYKYCNIIEISAVKYSNGERKETFSSLVKPPKETIFFPFRNNGEGEWVSRYVDDFVADLTGITNEMLDQAPSPGEVIPQFLDFISDSILIGHNVNFDINFLYDAAVSVCGCPITNDFIDTLRIARKVFPNLEHHRLCDIAQVCGVSEYNAHRAESDCCTTARCYEIMRENILRNGTEEEFVKLFLKRAHRNNTLSGITATVDEIDDTNPIFGKVVVFTGALSAMSRKEAFQLVANLGGFPADSITKKTNYLVIGSQEFAQSVKNGKTTKMKKAESYRAKGAEIAVVSESAFFDLFSDYQKNF